MIFIGKNVQTAVRDVRRRTDDLGFYLGVSARRRREIQSQFRGNFDQQVKEYVDYFMEHDPLASWRRVTVVLDELKSYGEKEGAEKIRHLAEAVTGEDKSLETLSVCVHVHGVMCDL